MTPQPKILHWHFWSALAVVFNRLEDALGPLGRPLQPCKWWALDRADAAYPPEHRRRNLLPSDSPPDLN